MAGLLVGSRLLAQGSVLFFQLRSPVEKDGERRGIGFDHLRSNQESLSVTTYIIGEIVLRGDRLRPVALKQCDRRSGFEAGTRRHSHCHYRSVCRQVEQLLAILAPSRFLASAARHLPLAVDTGKGGHVDLRAPCFIRGVGHPLAVWGKLRAPHRPPYLQ